MLPIYLYLWPLTFIINGPKSIQLIAQSNFTFVLSLMEFCPILLELGHKQWNFRVWPWSLTFDLKRISPKMKSDYLHLVVYIWMKYDQNLPRGSRDIVKKRFFTKISLTFDLWPWADFTHNLVSSSTPHGAHLGQVWSKSCL